MAPPPTVIPPAGGAVPQYHPGQPYVGGGVHRVEVGMPLPMHHPAPTINPGSFEGLLPYGQQPPTKLTDYQKQLLR